MDLWTGPLARASRLTAKGAHLWMAGWTTLQVAHAPTHRPSAAHKLHRAPLHLKKGKQETAKPFTTLRHQAPGQVHKAGAQPAQSNPITTIFSAQPGIQSKSVTFPKSPVTFAEIRSFACCEAR